MSAEAYSGSVGIFESCGWARKVLGNTSVRGITRAFESLEGHENKKDRVALREQLIAEVFGWAEPC